MNFFFLKNLYNLLLNTKNILFNKKNILKKYKIFYMNFLYFNYIIFFLNNKIFNKIKKKKKKNKLIFDLNFRFPKINLFIYNLFNFKLLKKKLDNYKIYINLPIIPNLKIKKKLIYLRNIQLMIGLKIMLPLNCTLTGYYSQYIINLTKKNFIKKFTFFFKLPFQKKFYKRINFNFKKYKYFLIFNSNIQKLNLHVIFFHMIKKKYRFLEISNLRKEYNIFNIKFKNYNFFKFDWNYKKKRKKKIYKKINIIRKQKHLLKFHRLNFNELFFFKYRSYRLNKIILKFSKYHNSYLKFYIKLELMLRHFLIRIGFSDTLNDSAWLVNNNYIYINKKLCKNIFYTINKNDILQTIINTEIYIKYRSRLSERYTRYIRMYRSLLKYFYIKKRPYKTQEKIKRKWARKSLFGCTDLPTYIELDYLTMTVFVLNKPKKINDIFPFFYYYFKISINKLYNWKYYY